MTTFDWNEPLDSPGCTYFWWTAIAVSAFDEDLDVTVYFETVALEKPPAQDPRLNELGAFVELAHEKLVQILRDSPEFLGLTRADADNALTRSEPGAFADAAELVLYLDGDTLVRFPFTDLPGAEEFGVGITVSRDGNTQLQDLGSSIEVGGGSA